MNKYSFPHTLIFGGVMAATVFFTSQTLAQYSTPAMTAAEREAIYAASIERRTGDIIRLLALTDAAKSNQVHDIIIAQYRSLQARDEAIDTMLKELSKNAPGVETNRAVVLPILSQTLHQQFLTKLSMELSPEQVELVKDKMTYDKVKVTYSAYCEIISGLDDKEKAKVLELLKAAREEAIDGGSATEKSAIFQKYKDQINTYLTANGHDVAKATAEWEARQEQVAKAKEESTSKAAPAAN